MNPLGFFAESAGDEGHGAANRFAPVADARVPAMSASHVKTAFPGSVVPRGR